MDSKRIRRRICDVVVEQSCSIFINKGSGSVGGSNGNNTGSIMGGNSSRSINGKDFLIAFSNGGN